VATIDDLIARIDDESLRKQLSEQARLLVERKEFGLVFQDHLPEFIEIPDAHPRRGELVKYRDPSLAMTYRVQLVDAEEAHITSTSQPSTPEVTAAVSELVVVKEFGDPIYAGFEQLGGIANGGSKPWHVVIEGENYYGLETLLYTDEKGFDVIYIDPPYNTGNADWVYNDAYIDSNDAFRHSKWLAFMQRRLSHAKRLLKDDGALVVSIGSDEVHNVALLLTEMFDTRTIHTVTVQTSGGKSSGGLKYVHEYVIFVLPTDFKASAMSFTGGVARSPWEGLTLSTFTKAQRPNQVFPIFVDRATQEVVAVGESLKQLSESGQFTGNYSEFEYRTDASPEGCDAVWPISSKGEECIWRLSPTRFMDDWRKGYINISKATRKNARNQFSIQYLPAGVLAKIDAGSLAVVGTKGDSPTLIFGGNETEGSAIPTIWTETSHYTSKGTEHLRDVLQRKDFPYPKPVSLIADILMAVCGNKPDAKILDFFAGTGTTAEATMLLNASDNGQRQSIIITNNELSADSAAKLLRDGRLPGDAKWEQEGIFRKVTRPRVETIVTGQRADKSYFSEGFQENVAFLKLTYEDAQLVSLGLAFERISPLLWLKAGATTPLLDADGDSAWAISKSSNYAVLFDVSAWKGFVDVVGSSSSFIEVAYIVTDSETLYKEAFQALRKISEHIEVVHLYEDYIRSFRINGRD